MIYIISHVSGLFCADILTERHVHTYTHTIYTKKTYNRDSVSLLNVYLHSTKQINKCDCLQRGCRCSIKHTQKNQITHYITKHMASPVLFFYTVALHTEICNLIQLKLLNILIGNNWLEKQNYINTTISPDYIKY